MLRGRFNYPDLDVLDSPLVSPTPLTSFSGIPGSALAERIFNDPDSWEDNDADDSDIPDGNEQLAWLTEEIERLRAGLNPTGAFDSPSTPTDKVISLVTTPTSAMPQNIRASIVMRDAGAGWKGIGKKGNVRPISLAALFEHSNEDFSDEIQLQLSKILESGGIPHHIRPYPPSSALSPPSTSGTSSTLESPLQLQTASSIASSNDEISPSPISVYSASATLSFLEWYGIYPDSPRLDITGRRPQPKSARLKTPLLKLQVPSPRHAARPSSLLSPTSTAETFTPLPPKRASSVPPPGLDPPTNAASGETRPPSPPGLSRSPSPLRAANHQPALDEQQSEPAFQPAAAYSSASERGRALHMTAPPPYSRTPSPAAPVSRSNSSTGTHPSRAGTPARGISQDQPIRRLPSIPPESSTSRPSTPPQPLPQPPVQVQPQTQNRASPPPPPQRVPSRRASPAPAAPAPQSCSTRQWQGQQPGPRPMSIRSPLGGPAGPRTRSRASQDVGHRPPVLRL